MTDEQTDEMWLDLLLSLFSLPTFFSLPLSLNFNKRISPHRRLLDYEHTFTHVQRDDMTCRINAGIKMCRAANLF